MSAPAAKAETVGVATLSPPVPAREPAHARTASLIREAPGTIRAQELGSAESSPAPSAVLTLVGSRLALAALVLAGTLAFAVVRDAGFKYVLGWDSLPHLNELIALRAGLIAVSFAVAAYARFSRVSPCTLVWVGHAFQIVAAAGIALHYVITGHITTLDVGHLSWVAVWITLYPLVVPAVPSTTIAANFLAASTIPAAFWLHTALGNPFPGVQRVVEASVPHYIAAAMAMAPAILIYRLSRSVAVAEKKALELGSYKLVRRLGEGGMGEVWQAEHRMLVRPAAVKLIKPELTEGESAASRDSLIKRFEREALATAALHSPHTVGVYDFGVAGDGTFYYVMELLQGLDLDSLVTRFGPVPPARVAAILRQVCESLAEAHQVGMVHRDIKPANIFLCRLGLACDFVKVLDFGLVSKAKGCCPREKDARLTGEGTIVGTPNYMSPEMARGRIDVDGRADIYALGCVAYWLLTGKLLFEAGSAMDTIIEHINTRPVRPSERLGRPIPKGLEDLVLECLEKDPAKRPATALELSRRLAAVDVGAPWTDHDARDWWSQHVPELVAPLTSGERGGFATTVIRPSEA